jgi:hypothetical protein
MRRGDIAHLDAALRQLLFFVSALAVFAKLLHKQEVTSPGGWPTS